MVITPAKFAARTKVAIHDVRTKPLRVVSDERGWLLEILRADDRELFTRFGQVYLSATYPGVVKAWHYHQVQVDNFACVSGMVKLVLTAPVPSAVRSCTVWPAHVRWTTSPGTHPGPEVTATTVPTGPEDGSSFSCAGRVIRAWVLTTPEGTPVMVTEWLP